MFEKIFRLGKETAIYGLSTIIGRMLNFLIVPFYAHVLLPAENGVISNIYAYIAFTFVLFSYGMEPAYMRFVASGEYGDKKQNFSIPFYSLLVTSAVFALGIHFNSSVLASMIGISPDQHYFIQYAGWILCFDTLVILPFASLRMDRKAKVFAGLKLFNISCNLLMNLFLILGLGMHAEGVFLANLIASCFTFLVMLGYIFNQLTFTMPSGLYRELLKFGIPYIPAGIAGIAMQVIDRPIVKALTNDTTLGIYQLNYRLGIFMMLIVGMFDYAWRPFFLGHAKDPDAKQLFAKVFTYFVLGSMTVFLSLSLFIQDLVRVQIFGRQFFPPLYWEGTEIVPWILLSYIFTGAYVVFVVGVYLEKKTKYLPLISGAGAAVNICSNLLLIPQMGILGAAISTLLSYIVMAIGMYFASQRFYPVQYEWKIVLKIAGFALALFTLFLLVHPEPLSFYGLFFKVGILCAYGIGLKFFGVLQKEEIDEIKSVLLRIVKNPARSSPGESEL